MFWLLFITTLVGLITLMRKEIGALAAIIFLAVMGLVSMSLGYKFLALILYFGAIITALSGLTLFRRIWLTPSIFAMFKRVAPKVSATEQVALDAGTVSWDGELFTGKPNWNKLLENPCPELTAEEQAFIDKQCTEVVSKCNSWDVAIERADLPKDVWDYLKKEGFLGMIIPKSYGGLEFSAKAQSAVLQKLAANESLMVSVGVPNSLGPGELLLKYGTQEQKDHYLPRLADGREIPCFGLTGPRAGF
jgi:acyl-CoA dehydrogenase